MDSIINEKGEGSANVTTHRASDAVAQQHLQRTLNGPMRAQHNQRFVRTVSKFIDSY